MSAMTKNESLNIPWLEAETPLPHPESAEKSGTTLAGLVAAGGGLSVARLCEAYQQGMFPWFSNGQPVLWCSPDPSMVLHTAEFKLHRSLRKTLRPPPASWAARHVARGGADVGLRSIASCGCGSQH